MPTLEEEEEQEEDEGRGGGGGGGGEEEEEEQEEEEDDDDEDEEELSVRDSSAYTFRGEVPDSLIDFREISLRTSEAGCIKLM
jgi:hypothetical protein